MYGTDESAVILASFSAIFRAWASVSITQGPAIRKSGLPPPKRSAPSEISRVIGMEGIGSIEDNTRRWENSGLAGALQTYAFACGATPTAWTGGGSVVARDRAFLCSSAAPMKAAKSGCGSSGLDLNSGWNWQPRNQGCSGASMIST